MSADKRACPKCGEAVYPTDSQCMACGADLKAAAEPAAAAPPPPPPPPPTSGVGLSAPPVARRPPTTAPFYSIVADKCGLAWDIFPWFYLVWNFVEVGSRAGVIGGIGVLSDASGGLLAVAAIVHLVGWALGPLMVFWIICDVFDQDAGWWWIPICFFCCLGLLIYLVKVRVD